MSKKHEYSFFPPAVTYLSMRNLIIIKWSAVRDPVFPLPWLLFISPSLIHLFFSLDCNNLLNNFPKQEFTATVQKLDGSVRLSDLWSGVSILFFHTEGYIIDFKIELNIFKS